MDQAQVSQIYQLIYRDHLYEDTEVREKAS